MFANQYPSIFEVLVSANLNNWPMRWGLKNGRPCLDASFKGKPKLVFSGSSTLSNTKLPGALSRALKKHERRNRPTLRDSLHSLQASSKETTHLPSADLGNSLLGSSPPLIWIGKSLLGSLGSCASGLAQWRSATGKRVVPLSLACCRFFTHAGTRDHWLGFGLFQAKLGHLGQMSTPPPPLANPLRPLAFRRPARGLASARRPHPSAP